MHCNELQDFKEQFTVKSRKANITEIFENLRSNSQ